MDTSDGGGWHAFLRCNASAGSMICGGMRFVVGVSCVALAVGGVVGLTFEEKVAFTFRGVGYVHRYSKDDLHEYTPKGKPSLEKWTDMVTVNVYRNVTDGEGLAAMANGVLETYKANQAMVVRTDSVPRTEKREAEHLIVVLFPRKEFIEAAFARFRMEGGRGVSIVYSHRVYGTKAGNAMSEWLSKNGPGIEKELMAMKSAPIPPK
ncbi:MAG: hypothetical protein AKCLJLPJ_01945 [Fimbriimonadales bacterium]|nr:hypothetical protein [Fimbriimonadales bacterium]